MLRRNIIYHVNYKLENCAFCLVRKKQLPTSPMSEGKLGSSVVLSTAELAPVTGYYCLVQVLGDRMICKRHVQRIMTETLLQSSA